MLWPWHVSYNLFNKWILCNAKIMKVQTFCFVNSKNLQIIYCCMCVYFSSGLQLIFVIQPFVHQNKHINCKHSSMAFIESVERPQMAQNRIKRDWEGQTSIFLGLTYGAIQKIFYRNMMKLDQIGSSYCYCDALLSHAWFILTTCIFFFKFCQFIYMYMFF